MEIILKQLHRCVCDDLVIKNFIVSIHEASAIKLPYTPGAAKTISIFFMNRKKSPCTQTEKRHCM